ncbi:MAG: amidohydrolase family protein [Solirubrobacterales bacterium]
MIDFRVRPPQRDDDGSPTAVIAEDLQRYDELYGLSERVNAPFAELEEDLERHGIRAIMQAEFEDHGRTRYWNQRVADLVGRRPDLLVGGIPGVDPLQPDALEELEWAHDELGLRGLSVQPCFLGLPASDPRIYPLYAYCQERDVPVAIHSGVNFGAEAPMEYERPILIDRVALDFPDLTIVMNHGGWPWVMEAVAVAWRHRHVYLEFGAIAPSYLASPNGGWQPIAHWMRTQLRDRILFGSNWPMIPYERILDELPLLGLPKEALDRYTSSNALEIVARCWPDNAEARIEQA